MNHGDILRSPDGLVGKLTVDENGECEVRPHDDEWLVRAWNIADLIKNGWRKAYRTNE